MTPDHEVPFIAHEHTHTHTHHYLVSFPKYQGWDSNQLHLRSGAHPSPIKYSQGVKERKCQ